MYVCLPLLTQLQVDETNRGHRHLVLCKSSKAVESGSLWYSVTTNCAEARSSCRKIDVSNCLCLFEFSSDIQARALLGASVPSMTFTKAEAYFWMVDSIDSNHIGHSQPYRECENNLYITYTQSWAWLGRTSLNNPCRQVPKDRHSARSRQWYIFVSLQLWIRCPVPMCLSPYRDDSAPCQQQLLCRMRMRKYCTSEYSSICGMQRRFSHTSRCK